MAVLAHDAGTADLDRVGQDVARQRLQRELAGRVEARPALGHLPGLHAVGADDASGGEILDQQVMAGAIEGILVATGEERGLQPFAELEVEHVEAQMEDLVELLLGASEPQLVASLTKAHRRRVPQDLEQLCGQPRSRASALHTPSLAADRRSPKAAPL